MESHERSNSQLVTTHTRARAHTHTHTTCSDASAQPACKTVKSGCPREGCPDQLRQEFRSIGPDSGSGSLLHGVIREIAPNTMHLNI